MTIEKLIHETWAAFRANGHGVDFERLPELHLPIWWPTATHLEWEELLPSRSVEIIKFWRELGFYEDRQIYRIRGSYLGHVCTVQSGDLK